MDAINHIKKVKIWKQTNKQINNTVPFGFEVNYHLEKIINNNHEYTM
jgi:hypothetical protein